MADKVRVPKSAGAEITVAVGGPDTARTWKVQNGLVSPANQDEHDLLLATIPGAKPAPENPKE